MSTLLVAVGTITTVAGTGFAGYDGDGLQATSAQLNQPSGLAFDREGSLYIADRRNNRVRCVDETAASPVITTVAGTGVAGYDGDGLQATSAQLNQPGGVAFDKAGSLYIADIDNHLVRMVDTDTPRRIFTVAGTGSSGYSGDGGPATNAQLNQPADVAPAPDGSLYIADWANHVVRRVGPDGMIFTVAGTGSSGYSGDGGPATNAQLSYPHAVAVDEAGSLYIADWANHVVRRVGPDGMIFTVAGTGSSGYSGDGGPATNAQLGGPGGLALAPDGSLYIADTPNHVVRRVGPDGMIFTVAGTGSSGYSGDGGPATNAQLMDPVEVAVDGAGNLYIADREGQRVRRVQMAPPATFTVEQASPNPVDMTPGMTTQMAFTVTAVPSPVPAGQSIGLTFPAGVGLAAGGVCRYICPANGTNIPLRTMDNGDGTVSVTAPEITGSSACFYSCDVQATTNASGILEGRITVDGTTQPVYFSVSPVTYTIEQASPSPVDVTPGMITQMAFTVTASATVTGQNITMAFPPGVVFPTDGVIRWICPADGTNIPQSVNTNANGTVSIPNQTITPSAACFYSCDLQATTNTAPGITEGTITVTGTNASGPFYCNITS